MVFSQQLPLLDANHDERNEGDNGAGFELEQRHIAAEFFKAGLDTVNLFGLGLFGRDFSWVFDFHSLEFLKALSIENLRDL